eukprot:Skav227860  [mRNA]  locus=scaffold383:226650:227693:+ [translate_table: standard]
MSHVFIEPAAGRLHRSQRMFRQPRQLVERRAVPGRNKPITFNTSAEHPFVGEKRLEEGTIVCWELDDFTGFIHAAVYAGPGTPDLQRMTGIKQLDPNKHYVIEVSGPNRTSGSLRFQVGKVLSGIGGQSIWLSEMDVSVDWWVYDIVSDDYGRPFNGSETKSRALNQLLENTSFPYDVFCYNCQHFAVRAKYDKPFMLLSEERLQTMARQTLGWAVLCLAAMAHNVFLAAAVIVFLLMNLLTVKRGHKTAHKISWKKISTAGQMNQIEELDAADVSTADQMNQPEEPDADAVDEIEERAAFPCGQSAGAHGATGAAAGTASGAILGGIGGIAGGIAGSMGGAILGGM